MVLIRLPERCGDMRAHRAGIDNAAARLVKQRKECLYDRYLAKYIDTKFLPSIAGRHVFHRPDQAHARDIDQSIQSSFTKFR